jgi:hypothetical protein
LNEIVLLASVAEKSFTGMETSPNEMLNEPIDRAAILASRSLQPLARATAAL